MAELLKTWTKNQTALFVNILQNNTKPQDWGRIGKSTIFDLSFNATVNTYDFIEQENPSDIIDNYKPTINQELRAIRGDKAFDAMFEYMYNLPTGDEAVRDALFVFPGIETAGSDSDEPKYYAWLASSSLVVTNFNTVDKKILFNLNFSGDIVRGTVQSVSGAPVFTPFTNQSAWVPTDDENP